MSKTLRVAFVGSGGISRPHIRAWQNLPYAEVVAVSDISEEAARGKAEEFDIPEWSTDPLKVCRRDDVDVIDVCTPNRFHKKYSVAALKAGKHVICEKPLALTTREVDEMIAASEESGRKLMCAQHQRFSPQTIALRKQMQVQPLGDIYYGRAWYNRRRMLPAKPGFYYHKNSGGGACIDVGVHVLDLAMHMMGNFEPVSVTGISGLYLSKRPEMFSEFGEWDKEGVDVEDFAAGMIRFANGAALSLECSFLLNQKEPYLQRIDLFGTEAGLNYTDNEIYTATDRDYVDTRVKVRDGIGGHEAEIIAFAECVRDDKPVPVQPRETRAVTAVLQGLYKSAKTGKEVRLS